MKSGSTEKSLARLDLARFYPERPRDAHKGEYGRVVVAGGSERYAGCLAFNALAALRAGADLAIIVAPRRAADIVAGYSPDLITVPCDLPFPDPRVVSQVLDGADSLVIGGGVIRSQAAHNALVKIIRKAKCPIVADAEALHAIANKASATKGKQLLLTPNAGEFHVLSRETWPNSNEERVRAVRALAKRYRSTVIVKGADDYISDGVRIHVDDEGSPYITKGGYGDLLAGVAGAILAKGHDPFNAARVAAYMVGKAGRLASEKLKESMLASDALAQLPSVVFRK